MTLKILDDFSSWINIQTLTNQKLFFLSILRHMPFNKKSSQDKTYFLDFFIL